jgi:hypothetical protein
MSRKKLKEELASFTDASFGEITKIKMEDETVTFLLRNVLHTSSFHRVMVLLSQLIMVLFILSWFVAVACRICASVVAIDNQ